MMMFKMILMIKKMMNAGKQVIVDTVDTVKAQVEVRTRVKMYDDTLMIDNVLVYHDDSVVRARGRKLACVIRVPGQGDFIIVDDRFLLLSEDAQRAVIHHESGHIECGHLDIPAKEFNRSQRKRMWKTMFIGKVDANELEADAYAVGIVGTECMVDALYEVLNLLGRNDEVSKRINAVQSL
jgi:hypothetical protein